MLFMYLLYHEPRDVLGQCVRDNANTIPVRRKPADDLVPHRTCRRRESESTLQPLTDRSITFVVVTKTIIIFALFVYTVIPIRACT